MDQYTLKGFQQLEAALSEQYGPFRLFGLFHFPARVWNWDLLVSAPWLAQRPAEAYEILADALAKDAGGRLANRIGGPRILDEGDPLLALLFDRFSLEHGLQVMRDVDLMQYEADYAFVITCQRMHDRTAA